MIQKMDSDKDLPLVTIGIPTYNRSALLKRAIGSVLNQDYNNIEVIVSDNCSPDDTESVCRSIIESDARVKYFRQSINCGPTANFVYVLEQASGQFFMWLADDDWIDPNYISTCVKELSSDPLMSLVSGVPQYYTSGRPKENGAAFNVLQDKWWLRVIVYYNSVSDNGMFYGVMRTSQIRQINIVNTMGGDWLMLANIISLGKAKMMSETSLHRERGGTSVTYEHIARSLGLPAIQAKFPLSAIATSAWMDITAKGYAFKSKPLLARLMVSTAVFFVILMKAGIPRALINRAKGFAKRLGVIKA